MLDQIKVSVCMITYNHGKYLEQAILGVLQQETTFRFELIIGNDCSTDTTDQIVKKLIKENPNTQCEIVYISHAKNVGSALNAESVFGRARGQYMALCEGDDFWHDNTKLQQQVDVMDKNPSATICFHAISMVNSDGHRLSEQRLAEGIKPSFKELFKDNFIHTPSVMYRIIFDPLLLDWMRDLVVGDWITHLRHAEKGEIIYIDKVMASYRFHGGGVWSMIDGNARKLRWIKVVEAVIENLFPQHELGLNYTKKNCLLALSASHFRSFQIVPAFKYLYQALTLKTDPPMTLTFLVKRVLRKIQREFLKRSHA